MFALRTANLVIAFIATTAPIAHALEMISKLTLDGPLWLGIQQHLYRGWGEIFGPVGIVAFLSTLALLFVTWQDRSSRRLSYSHGVLRCHARRLLHLQSAGERSDARLDARDLALKLERLSPSLGNWPRAHRPVLGDRIRHADPPTYPRMVRVVNVINFAGEAVQYSKPSAP
jgi:hypothetical protein